MMSTQLKIYIISQMESLNLIIFIIGFLSLVTLVIIAAMCLANRDIGIESDKLLIRAMKISAIIFIIVIVAEIFIPSSHALGLIWNIPTNET